MDEKPLDPVAEQTIKTVRETKLSPIEHRILSNLVLNAVDTRLISEEINSRINDRSFSETPESTLLRVKQELHDFVQTIHDTSKPSARIDGLLQERDVSRCCITPKSRSPEQDLRPVAAYVVQPSLFKLAKASESHMRLLRALFTDRFVADLSDTSDQGLLANSWLLAPDLQGAMQAGIAQVTPRRTYAWRVFDESTMATESAFELRLSIDTADLRSDILFADGSAYDPERRKFVLFELRTSDPKRLPIVSHCLLRIYSCLVAFREDFIREQIIALGWGPLQSPGFLHRSTQLWLRSIWLFIPKIVRSFIWRRLFEWTKGNSDYRVPISRFVRTLPGGLYVKMIKAGNEPAALQLLERESPNVPAPLYIDSFSSEGRDWFVMTRMPGIHADTNVWRMSYTERKELASDLRSVLDTIRRIPNRTPYMFCSASGGRIYDDRASADGCGPYNTEADLNAQLCRGVETRLKELYPNAFAKKHRSVFTHGDLYFSNILIDGGKFSAIIDWEYSGFMPEYWDFTKPLVVSSTHQDTNAIYRDIWGHEFDDELEVESWLGVRFRFGGPPEPE